MITENIDEWVNTQLNTDSMSVLTVDELTYVAENIGVPLITSPREVIAGESLTAVSRKASTVIKDRGVAYLDRVIGECRDGGLRAILSMNAHIVMVDGENQAVVTVRGIW